VGKLGVQIRLHNTVWLIYCTERMVPIYQLVDSIQADAEYHPDQKNTKNLLDSQTQSLYKKYGNCHLFRSLFDCRRFSCVLFKFSENIHLLIGT